MKKHKNNRTREKVLDDIVSYFDRYGDPWQKTYKEKKEAWYLNSPIILREKYALRMIQNEPKGTAIDLGCGIGHALIEMKKLGFQRVIGVDISDIMLKEAESLIANIDFNNNIELLKCDVQDLKIIEPSSIDVCITLGVIEYLNEDTPFLQEINRILRFGGSAVIQTRNYYCPYSRARALARSVFPRLRSKIYYREHLPTQFRLSLSLCGFLIEEECYSHFYILYPLNLIPVVRRLIKPFDNFLSKSLERFSYNRFSIYLASMYITKIRKVAEL